MQQTACWIRKKVLLKAIQAFCKQNLVFNGCSNLFIHLLIGTPFILLLKSSPILLAITLLRFAFAIRRVSLLV